MKPTWRAIWRIPRIFPQLSQIKQCRTLLPFVSFISIIKSPQLQRSKRHYNSAKKYFFWINANFEITLAVLLRLILTFRCRFRGVCFSLRIGSLESVKHISSLFLNKWQLILSYSLEPDTTKFYISRLTVASGLGLAFHNSNLLQF